MAGGETVLNVFFVRVLLSASLFWLSSASWLFTTVLFEMSNRRKMSYWAYCQHVDLLLNAYIPLPIHADCNRVFQIIGFKFIVAMDIYWDRSQPPRLWSLCTAIASFGGLWFLWQLSMTKEISHSLRGAIFDDDDLLLTSSSDVSIWFLGRSFNFRSIWWSSVKFDDVAAFWMWLWLLETHGFVIAIEMLPTFLFNAVLAKRILKRKYQEILKGIVWVSKIWNLDLDKDWEIYSKVLHALGKFDVS